MTVEINLDNVTDIFAANHGALTLVCKAFKDAAPGEASACADHLATMATAHRDPFPDYCQQFVAILRGEVSEA